jgi:hypothetical protein
MEAPPEEAQRRFRAEIGRSLRDMGFRLEDDEPGHLAYGTKYAMVGLVWLGFLVALWRMLSGHRIEVDFTAAERGCEVEIYGRSGRSVNDSVNLLGRNGHWPTNPDDPAWVLAGIEQSSDDPYSQWDEVDDVDLQDLDRITRRALKKSGRLKP